MFFVARVSRLTILVAAVWLALSAIPASAQDAFVSVSDVHIGAGGNSGGVSEGSTFPVTADFQIRNPASCPSCVQQIVIGTDAGNQVCLYNGIPGAADPGAIGNDVGVVLTAPATPGTYPLLYKRDFQFNCNDAVANWGSGQGTVIGSITVVATGAAFVSVTNLRINGGGSEAGIPAGSVFQLSAEYQIWNPGDCPGCIQQIVLGTDAGNRICLYDDIPGATPGATGGIAGVSPLTVPATPGTYPIVYKRDFQFGCGDALANWDSGQGTVVGSITVVADGAPFYAVSGASINGRGNTAVLEAGATFNLEADYQAWNAGACPSCIAQLVVGTDTGNRQCLYDDVPGVAPGDMGRETVPLKAPCEGGSYQLRYKSDLQFTCGNAIGNWGNNATGGQIGTIIIAPILDPTCGDVDDSGKISAPDALGILRGAVGTRCCELCLCDLDDNGTVAASDAQRALRKAVGLDVALSCPALCSGSGASVGGAAWFLGDPDQNCEDTCSARGLEYDEATRLFAGSDGTDENCGAVLDALGAPAGVVGQAACVDGEGCIYDTVTPGRYRCVEPATNSTAISDPGLDDRRACACK